jgi:hypothetical protein
MTLFDARDGEMRLTPAAAEALSEMLLVRRAEIIERAMADVEDGPISAVDVVRAGYAEPRSNAAQRNASFLNQVVGAQQTEQRYFWAYMSGAGLVVLGALVFGAAWLVSAFMQGDFARTLTALLLAAIGTGFVISGILISARALRGVRRFREEVRRVAGRRSAAYADGAGELNDTPRDPEMTFLNGWIEIERRLNNYARLRYGDVGPQSFGSLLTALTEDKVITPIQRDRIKRILSIRNELVHTGAVNESSLINEAEEIAEIIRSLDGKPRTSPYRP